MKKNPFLPAIAMSVGLIVLLGYLLGPFVPILDAVRFELTQWAVIVAGTAMLVGFGNLFYIHFLKIRRREKGSSYSLLLLVSLLGTLLLGVASGAARQTWMQYMIGAVIVPVEASLMAMLAVTLVYASIRLLRRRADGMTVLFLLSALLMLTAAISLPFIGTIPMLGDWIGPWLTSYPITGGARGLLLGVALGALVTGLRALFAMDRPYGGK
jgi:hypothetical protein